MVLAVALGAEVASTSFALSSTEEIARYPVTVGILVIVVAFSAFLCIEGVHVLCFSVRLHI